MPLHYIEQALSKYRQETFFLFSFVSWKDLLYVSNVIQDRISNAALEVCKHDWNYFCCVLPNYKLIYKNMKCHSHVRWALVKYILTWRPHFRQWFYKYQNVVPAK